MQDDRDPTDLGLPVEGSHARRSDPDTSKGAAAELAGSRRLGDLQEQVLTCIRRNPGCTAADVWRRMGRPREGIIRPRFAELRAAGFVENEPKGSPHRTALDEETGRLQMRWWVKGTSPSALAKPQGTLFPPSRVFD